MLPPIWCPWRVTAVKTGGTQITFRNGERTALPGTQSIKDAQFSQPHSLPDLHYSSSQSCPECLGGFKWQLQVTHNYFNYCYFLVLTYLLLLSFFYKAHRNNSVSKIGRDGFVTKGIIPQVGNKGIGHQSSNLQHRNLKRREKSQHIEGFFLPIKTIHNLINTGIGQDILLSHKITP